MGILANIGTEETWGAVKGKLNAALASISLSDKNLFDYRAGTEGYHMANTGVAGVNAKYGYSGFIPVVAGQAYYGHDGRTGMRFTAYYDSNKQWVSGGSAVEVKTFTPPAGVAFVRVTYNLDRKYFFQFEQSATPTAYEPYLSLNYARKSVWAGRKYSSFGDSLTAQGNFQTVLINALGVVHTNYGTGGTTVANLDGYLQNGDRMCSDSRINAIAADSDLISFMGGTNDWAHSIPLGTVANTSADISTFYGALRAVAEKLLARFPNKRIVWFAPPFGILPNRVVNDVAWTDTTGILNNEGLHISDYGAAIKVIAREYGFPFADMFADCGWNRHNYISYVPDNLHQNTTGGARLGKLMLNVINTLEPDPVA